MSGSRASTVGAGLAAESGRGLGGGADGVAHGRCQPGRRLDTRRDGEHGQLNLTAETGYGRCQRMWLDDILFAESDDGEKPLHLHIPGEQSIEETDTSGSGPLLVIDKEDHQPAAIWLRDVAGQTPEAAALTVRHTAQALLEAALSATRCNEGRIETAGSR